VINYQIGDWLAEPGGGLLTRGNEKRRLAPHTMDVLVYLAERSNEVVSIEELLDAVWSGSYTGDYAVHDVISKLRRAFKDDSRHPSYIETVPKKGYRLIASVRKNNQKQESTREIPFPSYEGDKPYIFLSFAHIDARQIISELSWLHDLGFKFSYDDSIDAGAEWSEALAEAIKQTSLFLYFVTPDSVQSQNCRDELNFAVENSIPIVAVHLTETNLPDGLSLTLSTRQAILKHKIPKDEYRQKLQSSIVSSLNLPINRSIDGKRKYTIPAKGVVIAAVTVTGILIIGLLLYNQQGATLAGDRTAEPVQETDKTPRSGEATNQEAVAPTLSIAVLPFVNMSDDVNQEYFVDGLTEEIINSLSRINRLSVTARSSSFAFKNKNIDLRRVAGALNVSHLIEGSVRKSGERVRVTAQLIDGDTGSHVFSKTFDRNLVDIFVVQEEISEQIAAVLKLALIHDDDQYDSALEKLDYIAVEQLISTRAQIFELTKWSITGALATLEKLSQMYPDTAAILGLQALALMELASTSGAEKTHHDRMIGFAERALALDPSNLDALYTLSNVFDDTPQYRVRAKQLNKDLIRYYPGRKTNYDSMLRFLARSVAPCAELQKVISSAPTAIAQTSVLSAWNGRIDTCLNPAKVTVSHAATNPELQRQTDRLNAFFGAPSDKTYTYYSDSVRENPNQRNLSFLHMYQMSMGAYQSAKETNMLIDYATPGFWRRMTSSATYLHSHQGYELPSYIINAPPTSNAFWIFPLIKYAREEKRADFIINYLRGVPDFPLKMMNRNDAYGLMLLQYHAGRTEQSQRTATTMLDLFDQYRHEYPESYQFYGLAVQHIVFAFYSGKSEQAKAILEKGFAKNYDYWTNEIVITRLILSPWLNHPTAIEFMDRIEKDRKRAIAKFNLK